MIFRLGVVADVPQSQSAPLPADPDQHLGLRRVDGQRKDAIGNHFGDTVVLEITEGSLWRADRFKLALFLAHRD